MLGGGCLGVVFGLLFVCMSKDLLVVFFVGVYLLLISVVLVGLVVILLIDFFVLVCLVFGVGGCSSGELLC